MGAYLFFVVCTGIWIAFGWALATRHMALDRAWAGIRGLPVIAKSVVWIVFLPWLSGLAVWESGWRTPHARRALVALVAAAFIVFWALMTFPSAGGAS
jgi:hypothetical protein